MSRIFKRCVRVTAYRSKAGDPGGFIYSNPTYFENLPNATIVESNPDGPTQFHIEAEIDKSLDSTPNTCTIKLANLNEHTRGELARLPLAIKIEAGFDGEFRHVFIGDLTRTTSVPKGTEWWTTMLVGDAARAYRHARAGVNGKSYTKNIPVEVVLRDVALSMGFQIGPDAVPPGLRGEVFAAGYMIAGPLREELTKLLAPYGVSWSSQNGKLVMLTDEAMQKGTAIVVDANHWLIDSPEVGTPSKPGAPPTLKFSTHLYPEIDPGKRIALTSRAVRGVFKALKVKHSINSTDGPFTTSVESVMK